MSKITRKFRDVSMAFQSHPVSHDVTTKTDANAVKQSIRNLVLMMHSDIPFKPDIGCQIYGLLFDNSDLIGLQIARQAVIDVLSQYEPRAAVIDVVITDSLIQNGVDITIFFTVLNNSTMESVGVFVNRLR